MNNNTVDTPAFIESPNFPVNVVNEASKREKGGGIPDHWEMVFWWARRPLSGARAIILASLLPEDTSALDFLKWIYPSIEPYKGMSSIKKGGKEKKLPVVTVEGVKYGIDFDKTPHNDNPALPSEVSEKLKNIKLLDPFAGFGSIPLEAVRLGIGEVVAVELLPTAYIFLKAILEYPKTYGNLKKTMRGRDVKQLGFEPVVKKLTKVSKVRDEGIFEFPLLIYDVARWGKWITEKLREDPDIKELYEPDVAVYIGGWEIKCPMSFCGRYTPLDKNWWLAKKPDKNLYVYMKPVVKGDKVDFEIVYGKPEKEPTGNLKIRGGGEPYAQCLLCGTRITWIDPETGRIYAKRSEAPESARKKLELYPRHVIKDWNKKLEEYLEGKIGIDELKKALARPIIRAKVKIEDEKLRFEPATQEDNEKLWKALEKLRQIWGDPDIPTEPLPPYGSRGMGGDLKTVIWGFDKWFKHFNPRQLLTLVKLVKLIREAGKKIEEEKLKEGWNKEEAYRYAEAVTTYLAIALCKYVDFNSVVTRWNPGWLKFEESLSVRGIAMVWSWTDSSPFAPFTGTWSRSLENSIDGLSYLVSAVSGSPSKVRVLRGDARDLKELVGEKFDVIVTDPPYRDNIPYVELSDLYYVWLKRALSDDGLAPRFHSEALKFRTQWGSLSPQEASYNRGRFEYFRVGDPDKYFNRLLTGVFEKMSELTRDNGLVVMYFAHTKPEAWIEIVEAGWHSKAKLRVTHAWSLVAELPTRTTGREKTALTSNIILVWRKRFDGREASISIAEKEARARAREALGTAEKSGLEGLDLFLATMVASLSTFTSYDRITRFGGELQSDEIVARSYRIAVEALVGEDANIKSPEVLGYIVLRRLFAKSINLGQTIDSQHLITLGYGIYGTTEKGQLKTLYELLVKNRIVKPAGGKKSSSSGRKIAKPKEFIFLSPRDAGFDSIKEVLSLRNIDPVELAVYDEGKTKPLTSSIDVLHLLEYAVHRGADYFKDVYGRLMTKYPTLTMEAIHVAKALSRIQDDPEANLCKDVLKNIYEG